MPDLNDDLIQQLTQAGLYPQQLAQLQRQYQLAHGFMQPQEAQGRQVGGTYVASSPLEHLSNALRPVIGALMQRSAMNREGELTGQLSSGRQTFARALQDSSGHPGELMPGGAGDQQRMQQLSMLGALSGDPAMENAAKMYQQQQHSQLELSKLQQQIDYQNSMLGLKGREQKTQFDPFGNRVTTPTHAPAPNSVLPLSTGGGGGPSAPKTPWTPQALDQSAEQYAISGDYKRMPGKAGAGFDLAVKNRAAELYPEASLAENKAGYVANQKSIANMQRTADSIDAFEGTALKNARMMIDTAKGIVDVGSPLFNKPLRFIQQQLQGDPRMTQFNAARQVAIQEIGKVLGGAVAGGAITDSQRHEVEGLISGNATIPQMEATLQTLEADMANRKAATQAGLQAIRGRMNPKAAQAGPATPPPPAGGAPGLSDKDAKAVEWARKNPKNADAQEILRMHGLSQ